MFYVKYCWPSFLVAKIHTAKSSFLFYIRPRFRQSLTVDCDGGTGVNCRQ